MSATDRQSPTKVETDLKARLEVLVADLGFDLEELHVTRVGRRPLVKVVVDADGGVELDDVADVSRAVDAHLDADDPFSGPFVLEVSSPGVERPALAAQRRPPGRGDPRRAGDDRADRRSRRIRRRFRCRRDGGLDRVRAAGAGPGAGRVQPAG